MEFKHKSVLLYETVDQLNIKPDGIYVDGTLGGGGHSYEIASRLSDKGRLIGIDQDEDAIKAASERLKPFMDRVTIVRNNYCNMDKVLDELSIDKVDGIMLDLGVSSYQLDERNRGFSYLGENVLDMRMDKTQKLDAKIVVNNYKEEELAKIIYDYGEERFSRQIAKNICIERKKQEITTTKQLVDIIEKSIPAKFRSKDSHPAKRTFQAIRIEVNNELGVLRDALEEAIEMLNVGGRISVITFHSLEDKIVKEIFNKYSKVDSSLSKLPFIPKEYLPKFKLIANITPSKEELEENNRARSSRLRVIERIED